MPSLSSGADLTATGKPGATSPAAYLPPHASGPLQALPGQAPKLSCAEHQAATGRGAASDRSRAGTTTAAGSSQLIAQAQVTSGAYTGARAAGSYHEHPTGGKRVIIGKQTKPTPAHFFQELYEELYGAPRHTAAHAACTEHSAAGFGTGQQGVQQGPCVGMVSAFTTAKGARAQIESTSQDRHISHQHCEQLAIKSTMVAPAPAYCASKAIVQGSEAKHHVWTPQPASSLKPESGMNIHNLMQPPNAGSTRYPRGVGSGRPVANGAQNLGGLKRKLPHDQFMAEFHRELFGELLPANQANQPKAPPAFGRASVAVQNQTSMITRNAQGKTQPNCYVSHNTSPKFGQWRPSSCAAAGVNAQLYPQSTATSGCGGNPTEVQRLQKQPELHSSTALGVTPPGKVAQQEVQQAMDGCELKVGPIFSVQGGSTPLGQAPPRSYNQSSATTSSLGGITPPQFPAFPPHAAHTPPSFAEFSKPYKPPRILASGKATQQRGALRPADGRVTGLAASAPSAIGKLGKRPHAEFMQDFMRELTGGADAGQAGLGGAGLVKPAAAAMSAAGADTAVGRCGALQEPHLCNPQMQVNRLADVSMRCHQSIGSINGAAQQIKQRDAGGAMGVSHPQQQQAWRSFQQATGVVQSTIKQQSAKLAVDHTVATHTGNARFMPPLATSGKGRAANGSLQQLQESVQANQAHTSNRMAAHVPSIAPLTPPPSQTNKVTTPLGVDPVPDKLRPDLMFNRDSNVPNMSHNTDDPNLDSKPVLNAHLAPSSDRSCYQYQGGQYPGDCAKHKSIACRPVIEQSGSGFYLQVGSEREWFGSEVFTQAASGAASKSAATNPPADADGKLIDEAGNLAQSHMAEGSKVHDPDCSTDQMQEGDGQDQCRVAYPQSAVLENVSVSPIPRDNMAIGDAGCPITKECVIGGDKEVLDGLGHVQEGDSVVRGGVLYSGKSGAGRLEKLLQEGHLTWSDMYQCVEDSGQLRDGGDSSQQAGEAVNKQMSQSDVVGDEQQQAVAGADLLHGELGAVVKAKYVVDDGEQALGKARQDREAVSNDSATEAHAVDSACGVNMNVDFYGSGLLNEASTVKERNIEIMQCQQFEQVVEPLESNRPVDQLQLKHPPSSDYQSHGAVLESKQCADLARPSLQHNFLADNSVPAKNPNLPVEEVLVADSQEGYSPDLLDMLPVGGPQPRARQRRTPAAESGQRRDGDSGAPGGVTQRANMRAADEGTPVNRQLLQEEGAELESMARQSVPVDTSKSAKVWDDQGVAFGSPIDRKGNLAAGGCHMLADRYAGRNCAVRTGEVALAKSIEQGCQQDNKDEAPQRIMDELATPSKQPEAEAPQVLRHTGDLVPGTPVTKLEQAIPVKGVGASHDERNSDRNGRMECQSGTLIHVEKSVFTILGAQAGPTKNEKLAKAGPAKEAQERPAVLLSPGHESKQVWRCDAAVVQNNDNPAPGAHTGEGTYRTADMGVTCQMQQQLFKKSTPSPETASDLAPTARTLSRPSSSASPSLQAALLHRDQQSKGSAARSTSSKNGVPRVSSANALLEVKLAAHPGPLGHGVPVESGLRQEQLPRKRMERHKSNGVQKDALGARLVKVADANVRATTCARAALVQSKESGAAHTAVVQGGAGCQVAGAHAAAAPCAAHQQAPAVGGGIRLLTGAGQPIIISEEAKRTAAALFGDILLEDSQEEVPSARGSDGGRQQAGGADQMQQAPNAEAGQGQQCSSEQPVQLTTGAFWPLHISSKALQKAKALLGEQELKEAAVKAQPKFKSPLAVQSKAEVLTEQAGAFLSTARHECGIVGEMQPPDEQKVGWGQNMHADQDALLSAKAARSSWLFHDQRPNLQVEAAGVDIVKHGMPPKAPQLCTGGGAVVQVSADAMACAAALLGERECDQSTSAVTVNTIAGDDAAPNVAPKFAPPNCAPSPQQIEQQMQGVMGPPSKQKALRRHAPVLKELTHVHYAAERQQVGVAALSAASTRGRQVASRGTALQKRKFVTPMRASGMRKHKRSSACAKGFKAPRMRVNKQIFDQDADQCLKVQAGGECNTTALNEGAATCFTGNLPTTGNGASAALISVQKTGADDGVQTQHKKRMRQVEHREERSMRPAFPNVADLQCAFERTFSPIPGLNAALAQGSHSPAAGQRCSSEHSTLQQQSCERRFARLPSLYPHISQLGYGDCVLCSIQKCPHAALIVNWWLQHEQQACSGPTPLQVGLKVDELSQSILLSVHLTHPAQECKQRRYPCGHNAISNGKGAAASKRSFRETASCAIEHTCFSAHDVRSDIEGSPGAKSTATQAWVVNHVRHLAWKLVTYAGWLLLQHQPMPRQVNKHHAGKRTCISTDTRVPGPLVGEHAYGGCAQGTSCLPSRQRLGAELRRRCHREYVLGQRSALHRVLEQDLPSTVPLVLLVHEILSAVQPCEPKDGTSLANQGAGRPIRGEQGQAQKPASCQRQLLLSDGWYSVRAVLDGPLEGLIEKGRISPGMKLKVVGAELVANAPAPPLQAFASAYLKLHANRTHPAPWSHPLGAFPQQGSKLQQVGALRLGGGPSGKVALHVVRRYDVQYWECGGQGASHGWVWSEQGYAKRQRCVAADWAKALEQVQEQTHKEEVQFCQQIIKRKAPGGMRNSAEHLYAAYLGPSGEPVQDVDLLQSEAWHSALRFAAQRKQTIEARAQSLLAKHPTTHSMQGARLGHAATPVLHLVVQPLLPPHTCAAREHAQPTSHTNIQQLPSAAVQQRQSQQNVVEIATLPNSTCKRGVAQAEVQLHAKSGSGMQRDNLGQPVHVQDGAYCGADWVGDTTEFPSKLEAPDLCTPQEALEMKVVNDNSAAGAQPDRGMGAPTNMESPLVAVTVHVTPAQGAGVQSPQRIKATRRSRRQARSDADAASPMLTPVSIRKIAQPSQPTLPQRAKPPSPHSQACLGLQSEHSDQKQVTVQQALDKVDEQQRFATELYKRPAKKPKRSQVQLEVGPPVVVRVLDPSEQLLHCQPGDAYLAAGLLASGDTVGPLCGTTTALPTYHTNRQTRWRGLERHAPLGNPHATHKLLGQIEVRVGDEVEVGRALDVRGWVAWVGDVQRSGCRELQYLVLKHDCDCDTSSVHKCTDPHRAGQVVQRKTRCEGGQTTGRLHEMEKKKARSCIQQLRVDGGGEVQAALTLFVVLFDCVEGSSTHCQQAIKGSAVVVRDVVVTALSADCSVVMANGGVFSKVVRPGGQQRSSKGSGKDALGLLGAGDIERLKHSGIHLWLK